MDFFDVWSRVTWNIFDQHFDLDMINERRSAGYLFSRSARYLISRVRGVGIKYPNSNGVEVRLKIHFK